MRSEMIKRNMFILFMIIIFILMSSDSLEI
jgi:hypothetical protein